MDIKKPQLVKVEAFAVFFSPAFRDSFKTEVERK